MLTADHQGLHRRIGEARKVQAHLSVPLISSPLGRVPFRGSDQGADEAQPVPGGWFQGHRPLWDPLRRAPRHRQCRERASHPLDLHLGGDFKRDLTSASLTIILILIFDLLASSPSSLPPSVASPLLAKHPTLASIPSLNQSQHEHLYSMADDALFAANLLSPDVQAALPEGYKLRALRRSDFSTGFLDCLRVLTTVGDVNEDGFQKQYDQMLAQGCYYIIVIEDPSRAENPVVATGALIVERKLYVPPTLFT